VRVQLFITCRKQQKSFCYDQCEVNPCAPLEGTHFENRKSILHFIALMVLHTVSSQLLYQICVRKTGNPTIVLVLQINNMIAHFTILFFLLLVGKFVQTPQVLCTWIKMEWLWYVKKSEVWKDDDNNNKYCIRVRNQTSTN